jgi:hypothetical protein
LSKWPSLRQRSAKSKKRRKQLELRIQSFETKSETSQDKQILRRRKCVKNMNAVLKNIQTNSDSSLDFRRKTLPSLRISTRRFKRYTRERWTTCKKNSSRKLKRWRSLNEEGS